MGATTIAQVLKRAGYTTGIFGKWHLGDEAGRWPDKRGFDEMFIHGGGGIGQTFPGSCGDAPGNTYFDPAPYRKQFGGGPDEALLKQVDPDPANREGTRRRTGAAPKKQK